MYKNGLRHCKAFIAYPEKFYNYSNEEEIHTDIPVIVASNEQIKAFEQFPAVHHQKKDDGNLRYRLEEADILQLMEGRIDKLVVVNEYQRGYSCIQCFIK